MLLKLIKYDFKSTYVKMLTVFAVFVLVCIIVPPVIAAFNTMAAIIYLAVAVSCGNVALFIIVYIFIFQNYGSNLYGNEGYLMFTLPTNGKKLLSSKLIAAIVWIMAAIALSIASLLVMVQILKLEPNAIKGFTVVFGSIEDIRISLGAVFLCIFEFVLAMVLFCMEVYFSISVAKLPLWHKLGGLMGFVTFFAVNLLSSVPDWIYNNVASDLKLQLNDSIANSGHVTVIDSISAASVSGVDWVSVLTSVIMCVALFFATSYLLDKKTSLK
jgi:hypothetical protein